MEFWEGAILLVGGVWLVGHMSRRSGSHPVNQPRTYSSVPSLAQQTNTAGTSHLVAGESLTAPMPTIPVKNAPVAINSTPIARPIMRANYLAM